ncbi:cell division protein FtsQ/DivIB [Paenactinomyces guangxiensis]|uniref:FtsQ-type POTRA domain-containing protein n=1 Tax=Paenactinomyces guangxiensis TaxID=1490290 RepID=A0A7W1WQK5_9BACL|nr:FtsQ-type POTRA domain-containing protein [Paenactinomyces guangxiensis]MBA4494243.1 FtsQ-type POTRA domain-containing protein [Paenactinomyces guangxiensis]MBH8590739.1 FtsQ-type POTRA domain-containing protein [Paenactinomyces guangxiensis]
MERRVPPFPLRIGKKRSPSPWVFGFIFLFFMGMLFVLFLRSPLSEIERIEITGNQLLSEREILDRTHIAKGVSYFTVSGRAAEQSLRTLPEVKQVKVTKVFPNKVYIHVQEKPSTAILSIKGQQLLPILADGSILAHRPVSSVPTSIPVFRGWTASNPLLKIAVRQLAYLPAGIRREIETVKPVPDQADQVEIWSRRNHKIFVRASDLNEKMSYYPSLMNHPRGTLYLLESIWFAPDKAISGKSE